MNNAKMLFGGLLVAALALVSSPALSGLPGSNHDFTAGGSGAAANQTTDMCGTCHMPHKPLLNVPLWAHPLSAENYSLYKDNANYSSGNAAEYDATRIGSTGSSISRACLSCHDGTVAVIGAITLDTVNKWILYDNETGSPAPFAVGGTTGQPTALGLKGSHPVSVDYATNIAGTGTFETTANVLSAGLKLEGGTHVGCISCHDPHMPVGVVGDGMTRIDNTNSAMCRTCHLK